MKKTTILWIFLGSVFAAVVALLLFIQSQSFARVLKQVVRKYVPIDLHMEGDFSELEVKFIPPGVVVLKPSVVLKEKNPAGLPAGTKLDAQSIDVTFQFFQLLNGQVNINAFAIHGAKLKLDLNEDFFTASQAEPKQEVKKKLGISFDGLPLSWDNIVKFHFRSVSLVDAELDFHIVKSKNDVPTVVSAYVKELTLGRGTIDGKPTYDIAADLQKAYIEFGTFKRSFAQFQTSMELSEKGVQVKNLGWQDGELTFHADGKVNGNVLNPTTLKSELSYLIRGPLSQWLDPSLLGSLIELPKNFPIEGMIMVEGKMSGDLLNVKKSVETNATVTFENPTIGEWNFDKLVVKGAWKAPEIKVEQAEVEVNGGKVRLGRFDYDIERSNQSIGVKAELDHADLRKLLGPVVKDVYPLHMLISGEASAQIALGNAFSLSAETNFKLNDFSFDNQKPGFQRPLKTLLALDEVNFKSKIGIDKNGVRIDSAEVNLNGISNLRAQGKVDAKNGFDLAVAGKVEMSEFKKLSTFDIGGRGDLLWTIKGKKKPGVVLSFDIDVEDAYYLDLKLGKAKGRIVYNDGNDTLYFENLKAMQGRTEFTANGSIDLGDSDKIEIDVGVPSGAIQDLAEVFSTFLKRSVPWYPADLLGQMSGVIRARGKTGLADLSVMGEMQLENVSVWHETIRSAKVHGGYRRGDYVAENLELKKKTGFINGNIVFADSGGMKFDFKSKDLTSLDFDLPASLGIPYRAPIDFQTEGSGKFGNLKGFFNVNVGEGFVKLYRVPPVELKMTSEGGRLKTALDVFSGQLKGAADLGWDKGSNSTFDLTANHFHFQPIVVAINSALADDPELDANLSGEAHLRFQTGNLSKLTGKVALESYMLKRKGYLLNLKKPVHFQLSNGNYEFDGAGFGGTGTDLAVSGRVQSGRIFYNIAGPMDLGIFEFLIPEVASFRGKADVRAKLVGDADSPKLEGNVRVDKSDLRLRSIEQPFEDLKYKVNIDGAHLKINEVSAKYAGGTLKGGGQADMYISKVPTLDFRFDLDDPRIKVFPVAYARAKGKLGIKGEELPYKVKGALNIAEALVTENFSLSEGSKILRSSKFIPQKRGGGSGDLQIFDLDIDIVADRNIFIRNDLFDLEVKGKLKVINGIRTPRLLGEIGIMHGRLLFKDNSFNLTNGEVRFNNPSALDPEFNLTGQTEVKGYKINMNAGGKVSDYKLSFQSNPPLSQNDIVNLLTLGVVNSNFQSVGDEREAYSRDEMYNLLFSQSQINKGLQDKLGVKVRIDQSQLLTPENAFRARSASEIAGSSVSPKVVLQKQVTKNLKATVGSTVGVGDSQERNANVELGVTKNLSVMGVYEDQRAPLLRQQRTSIGADLRYKKRFK